MADWVYDDFIKFTTNKLFKIYLRDVPLGKAWKRKKKIS